MMSIQHFNSFSLMTLFEGLDINSTVTLKRVSVRLKGRNGRGSNSACHYTPSRYQCRRPLV